VKRRTNGEGSVRYNPTKKLYEARFQVRLEDGTLKRYSFYGKTSKEALEKMREGQKRAEQDRPVVDAKLRLGDWLAEWSNNALELSERKQTTKDLYRTLMKHISGHTIAKKELSKVLPSHLNKFFSDLRAGELSASTLRNLYAILSAVFKDAIRERKMSENPLLEVARPKRTKTEARYLTALEVRSILYNAQNLRYRTALQLIAGTGLRRGEALALRWQDVDLDSRLLHVRATLARTNMGLNVTPPKTESALRQIALADSLVEVLKFHRITQDQEKASGGNKYIDKGFLFATETGEPVDPRNLFRALVTASRKGGISGVGLHTLRHSAATTMLESGVPIHVVSRVLGHSGINITVDIYGHVSNEASRLAMEALNTFLDG
jgi:integrase